MKTCVVRALQVDPFCSKLYLFSCLKRCQLMTDLLYLVSFWPNTTLTWGREGVQNAKLSRSGSLMEFRQLHAQTFQSVWCEDRVLDGPASGEKGSKGERI